MSFQSEHKSEQKSENSDSASFVFYESFYKGLSQITDDALYREVTQALFAYGLYGETAGDLSEAARMFVALCAVQIDQAKRRRAQKIAAGRKGGRVRARRQAQAKSSKTKQSLPDGDGDADGNADKDADVFGGAGPDETHKKNKKPYGTFQNVTLTADERENLPYQLGTTWREQVDKLSAYKKSHPAFVSADDYATLKLWQANARLKAAENRPAADEDTARREAMLDESLDADVEALWADLKTGGSDD